MTALQMNMTSFLGTFTDVINMMMDVGLLSSHVFSYAVSPNLANIVVEERHLQLLVKFLGETKDILNQLTTHSREKEGFQDIVIGFDDQRDISGISVSGPCTTEAKGHESQYSVPCGSATYAQMKNASGHDVQFNTASQQQYSNINENTNCELPASRFSPLGDTSFNTSDALSDNRHYGVTNNVNQSCYNLAGNAVATDSSLSSHNGSFSLQNHMVAVNAHFQQTCDTSFNAPTPNSLLRFPSCSRDPSLKHFASTNESQNHQTQYVSHDKNQNFSVKPSCEFVQHNETGDSQQHFTSPRGHFSPPNESNCDTLYTSRSTQEAHFNCDTSFDTSNHSGHSTSVPFQTCGEQSLTTHFAHSNLQTDASFTAQGTKEQHNSAFSLVNVNNMSSVQYPSCQGTSDKTSYRSNEAQNKLHYTARSEICDSSFEQLNNGSSFVELNGNGCNSHVTSQGVTESRFGSVSNFKWGVLSDTDDSFDPSSPSHPPSQSEGNNEFEDLQIALSNELDVNINITESSKKVSRIKESVQSSTTTTTAAFSELQTDGLSGTTDIRKKKLAVLDGAKQEGGKWKCPVCGKLFIARSNLDRHYRAQYMGEKPFPCNLCDKGFSSKIRLDAHLMRQHNLNHESANPCPVCGKLFNTKSALKTHCLIHADESEKPFACNICNKRFAQKVVLDTHLLHHGGPSSYKYQCKVCSKSFPTKPKLKFHWRKHETAQFSCDECSKQFVSEVLLRAHQASHINVAQRPFNCSQCPKTFNTKHKLQQHIETHSETFHYSCSQCSAEFRCRGSLVAHVRKRHEKTLENNSCPLPECSNEAQGFKAPQQLDNNLTSDVLQPRSNFKCAICLKDFSRRSNLRQHELTCHQSSSDQKTQPYACEHCPKKFKFKAKLKIHLSTHTEEPRLACSTCGKRFYRTDLLRTHEATHTGNKPFTCDVCARRFATRSMLRSHQITHQPPPETVEEVPCPTCGKKFKNKRTLALHVKSHAASLEFRCGSCGKQFARRVHYDGHMRTHSQERPYSCTVCNRTFRERKHRADHMKRLHPNEVLGGGELTLQGLIDSITADDSLDASTAGTSFESGVHSDALASLTELSSSGMQHLLESSTQGNTDTQMDDAGQTPANHLNQTYSSQSQNIALDSQVDSSNQNHLNQSFASQSQGVALDCQTAIAPATQVTHMSESFSAQSQNLTLLQNSYQQLKSGETEQHHYPCSGNEELSPLPELSGQLQAMEACHYAMNNEHKAPPGSTEETRDIASLPKLSDMLDISMQGSI